MFVFLVRRTRPFNIFKNPACTKTFIFVTWLEVARLHEETKWIGYCLLDSFLGWGIIFKVPNGLIITFTIYFILIKRFFFFFDKIKRILNDREKNIFELKGYILTINKIKFGVKGWHFIIYFTQIFFISLKKVVHHLCPHQKSLHGRLVV